MEKPIEIYQVDAFATEAFRGNPAAVCLLHGEASGGWMQKLAAEMNLSETAFVTPGEAGFGLRWFTPTTEVPLCGHATLASAHILFEKGIVADPETIKFHTLSGVLNCTRTEEHIRLDLPASMPVTIKHEEDLEAIIGTRIVYTGRAGEFALVEIESEEKLRALRPNLVALAGSPWGETIVTCEGHNGTHDFLSRVFAPGVGIAEDPVTGAAHCVLAPYWAKRLGKSSFKAYQASARGGEMDVELLGDRVALGGTAVTVLRGTLVEAAMPR